LVPPKFLDAQGPAAFDLLAREDLDRQRALGIDAEHLRARDDDALETRFRAVRRLAERGVEHPAQQQRAAPDATSA
jgi:hypothetical protein